MLCPTNLILKKFHTFSYLILLLSRKEFSYSKFFQRKYYNYLYGQQTCSAILEIVFIHDNTNM